MSHPTPHNPSPSQYQFSLNPSVSIPRCSITRPFSHKTTIDSGYLYPLYVDEVLPGDTFNVNASILARLTTPIVPFMDNLYLDMHFFFIPYRLVWDNFVKMHGEQVNPGDSIAYTMPTLTPPTGGEAVGSLSDYLGLPTGVEWNTGDVHSLVHRAYNLVWNEWYRDENLQNSVTVSKGDGPDLASSYSLLKRNKRKDYFTSALPWPQKGGAVTLSLTAGNIPVFGTGKSLGLSDGTYDAGFGIFASSFTGSSSYNATSVQHNPLMFAASTTAKNKDLGTLIQGPQAATVISSNFGVKSGATSGSNFLPVGVTTDPTKSGLVANLSSVQAFTINEIRTAFQIQKLLEASARGGTRYTELLYTMFGVQNPDARLQRPELLGSFSIPVTLNTVPQTSGTESGGAVASPQGNLAAFGLANGVKHAFDKSFTEFGVVLGLASIRSDQTYQYGIPRMYSRQGRYDFYYPVFAHLGEQAIYNKEIFCSGTQATDDLPFGYQERWSEYKYSVSRITGQLRSSYAQSLDVWHLAQAYSSTPTLSSSFIEENPPLSRVLAVQNVPQFVVDSYFHQNCVRPMPLYSIPGLIDHF